MRTRAGSARKATDESNTPLKRPARKSRSQRKVAVLGDASNNANERVTEGNVELATKCSPSPPDESSSTPAVGERPPESDDGVVRVDRESPALTTAEEEEQQQHHQQHQQPLRHSPPVERNATADAVLLEQRALEGNGNHAATNERLVTEHDDTHRVPVLEGAAAAPAPGDVAAKTRRASSHVLRQRQVNNHNQENHGPQRRSARCLSMSASSLPRSSSPVRASSPVPATCDVAVIAEAKVNDAEEQAAPAPAPAPADGEMAPQEGGAGSGSVVDHVPQTAPAAAPSGVLFEDIPHVPERHGAALAFTTRRASVPCRRSEKHPASMRHRPFSVGGSLDPAIPDSSLHQEPFTAPPNTNATTSTWQAAADGSYGAVGWPGDREEDLPPAPEEPAAPASSTGEAQVVPASPVRALECCTSPPNQHLPWVSGAASTPERGSPFESPVAQGVRFFPAAGEEEEEEEEEEEDLATPRPEGLGAPFALVDYGTSPSAAGSPAAAPASTGSTTPCALTALADYGWTPSAPRTAQQPPVEGGPSTAAAVPVLCWAEEVATVPDLEEAAADGGGEAGARESQGRGAGEAPVAAGGAPVVAGEASVTALEAPATADEAPVYADPAVSLAPEQEEEEEGGQEEEEREGEMLAEFLSGSSPISETPAGVSLDVPPPVVVEEVQETEAEPVAVACFGGEGGIVEPPREEPALSLLAESQGVPPVVVADIDHGKRKRQTCL